MQKRVEDSQVEQIFMVHPEHLNGAGRLFGGQINRAYLILVAVDKDGKPKEVPELRIETESQRAEWEAAQRRKAMHIQRNEAVRDEIRVIVNLASKEYSKCIEKYLTPEDRYITITFCEKSGDKLVTKGTYAKMARGEMVRYMAEHQIEDPVEIRNFDRLGYVYRDDLSSDKEYIFERLV